MIKLFEEFNKEPEVKIHDNGQKKSEIWKLNDKLHREDGPAVQWWFDNGQKWYEIWHLNGKSHREDGPAFQNWYVNGQKLDEEWWLNGEVYSREDWIKKLKDIGSKHYEEQKIKYEAEKYNL